MEELLKRYRPAEVYEILVCMKELGERTRKSKKISEKRKITILKEWEKFDTDVVIAGVRVYLKMKTTPAQNEKYLTGILRNKQKEKEAANYGKRKQHERGTKQWEALLQYAPDTKEELVCDF